MRFEKLPPLRLSHLTKDYLNDLRCNGSRNTGNHLLQCRTLVFCACAGVLRLRTMAFLVRLHKYFAAKILKVTHANTLQKKCFFQAKQVLFSSKMCIAACIYAHNQTKKIIPQKAKIRPWQ